MNTLNKKKILLGILPYWDPLIPPQGVAYLKSYLVKFGYDVKTIDVNIEGVFKDIYNKYFNLLKSNMPEYNTGNFYNIGHDVLGNHMMAHIKYVDEAEYTELVKILIYKSYYVNIDMKIVLELNSLLDEFYNELEKYIINLIESEKPEVFGLTAYKGTLPASLYAFKLVKKKYPNIKTVMGGGTFSDTHYEDTPNYYHLLEETESYVDKILIGNGEKLLLKYLQGELSETKRVYSQKDKEYETLDLECIGLPELSDFNLDNYPYLAAYSSTSCPHQCSFCNVTKYYGKYKRKSAKQTVDEMVKLKQMYKKHIFFMLDSLLNNTISDVANEIINIGDSLYYDGYLRVGKDVEDINKVLLWRRGGFYRARMGVESGSDNVLKLMRKGIDVNQIKRSITNLAYAGIKTTVYIVIGHPGETEKDFQMTLDLIEELKDDIWQVECNPFGYYYSGQTNSDEWADKRLLLYPEEAQKMLVFDSWTLNCYPSREETYDRVFRLNKHCREIGIPNPYSLNEIYEADIRWRRLHANAVPSLVDLMAGKELDNEKETKRKLFLATSKIDDFGEFSFE